MDLDHDIPQSSPPLSPLPDTITTSIPTKLASSRSPSLPPRKRSRNDDQGYQSASSITDALSNSSDAPFFSSDDLAEADASKYEGPLRKKQYRRRWYQSEREKQLVSYKDMRAATRQPKDSGIYMNSDSSNSSFNEGFELETANLQKKATSEQNKKFEAFLSASSPCSNHRQEKDEAHSVKDEVKEAVSLCLETGNDTIDLTGLNIEKLPAEYFRPLQYFVKQPRFHPGAYTDAACARLTPDWKVYLANNQLTRIPASLFDLSSLRELSLRNNNISELPTAIARLKNLRILNLAGNPLRYVPWELIHLINGSDKAPSGGALEALYVNLSDMTGPIPPPGLLSRKFRRTGRVFGLQRDFFTCPALFNADGSLACESLVPSPSGAGESFPRLKAQNEATVALKIPSNTSRIPSLFELALRTCAGSSQLPDLMAYLPFDSPPTAVQAIENAQRVIELEGPDGRTCSACGKSYIIARAEWLEYGCYSRCMLPDFPPTALTLLRRFCSWGCASDAEQTYEQDLELESCPS